MKKTLIHDWLDAHGGAERVITAISELYDFDYYYTYVNKMNKEKQKLVFAHKNVQIVESALLKNFKPWFRYLMPFFPSVVKAFNRQTQGNKTELVISSSWALSKGYRIGNELHICYLQARNLKYVWEESDLYFKGPLKLLSFLKTPLQRFDVKCAQVPDYLISNSTFVRKWVKEKYGRDSTVIYPPVDVHDFYISDEKEDYYIIIGRIEPYKRFDVVIDAFTRNGRKLLVVGDGSQLRQLKARSGNNIQFLGFKPKEEIKHLLSRAKAFVFSGVEDFGIAIVEALASGVPVIAYEGGASKEMINARNGMLYTSQSPVSLTECLESFEEKGIGFYDHVEIRRSSFRFSKERFQQEFSQFIAEKANLYSHEKSNA